LGYIYIINYKLKVFTRS